MAELASERILQMYARSFEEKMELLKLIEERKKEIKPGILGKGTAEEFKKYRLEVYEQ